VVVACAVTALVAAGVVGLRWHYFTDTVGGVALGTGTVLTLAFLIDLVPGVMRSRRVRSGTDSRWGLRLGGRREGRCAVAGGQGDAGAGYP
jgi:hypothetical protein